MHKSFASNEDGIKRRDNQLELGQRWCVFHKREVHAEYCDEASSGGRMDNRPGLAAALDEVTRIHGVLVVYSLSRLARSTRDAIAIFERLNKACTDIVSICESIDTTSAMGRFSFVVMAAIATLEREQISERTRDAMRHHQRNGRRMSDRCPYGWRRKPEQPSLMVPDEEERQVITKIMAAYGCGMSLRAITRQLEAEGILCRGGPWYHTTIKAILDREGVLERATQ